MGGVAPVIRDENVRIDWHPADARDAIVGELDRPWVAEEGPLSAMLSRWDSPSPPTGALSLRGLAFDATTTVVWDEDAVQVIRVDAEPDPDTFAVEHDVLVRQPRHIDGWRAPKGLKRTDYLRQGACVASRWHVEGDDDA